MNNFHVSEIVEEVLEVSSTPVVSVGLDLNENICSENDIGLWPENMTSNNIDYCIKIGASAFQNCDQDIIDNK